MMDEEYDQKSQSITPTVGSEVKRLRSQTVVSRAHENENTIFWGYVYELIKLYLFTFYIFNQILRFFVYCVSQFSFFRWNHNFFTFKSFRIFIFLILIENFERTRRLVGNTLLARTLKRQQWFLIIFISIVFQTITYIRTSWRNYFSIFSMRFLITYVKPSPLWGINYVNVLVKNMFIFNFYQCYSSPNILLNTFKQNKMFLNKRGWKK